MRLLRPSSLILALALALLVGGAAHADTPPPAPPATPIGRYYAELQKLGVIDTKTGTQDTLKEELAVAEAALERGDLAACVSALYGIVDSPRFTDFSDTVAYENAQYDLVAALVAAGGYQEALYYADRVLLRGTKAAYFAVTHRRAVDVALATRDYARVLAHLESLKIDGELPRETVSERSYLRGRAFYEAGKYDDSERELAQVSRRSRLYTSAVYLRGAIRVRQGKLDDAVGAFCEIAQTPDDDRYTFFIDDRYYGLKDLARLGAGRIAHEEGRYDDAYYHYFQIPDDSDRLPEALFEAAWSMYQKRELRTARELIKAFEKQFGSSPLRPEAMLLHGYIELADCKFEDAEKAFDALAADVRPLLGVVETAQTSPTMRQFLMGKALERSTAAGARARGPSAEPLPPLSSKPEDRVLQLLRLDPRLVRLNDALAGAKREAAASTYAISAWRQLLTHGHAPTTAPADAPAGAGEARKSAELLGDVRRLREEARKERVALYTALREKRIDPDAAAQQIPDLDRAEAELGALEAKAAAASSKADEKLAASADPALRAIFTDELGRAEKLAAQTREMSDSFDKTADAVAEKDLVRVRTDLRRFLDKARLGKVDSVIGEKRKLEKDIEDISNDNYVPPELAKAFMNKLIGEDEEYWPPEEEVWDDEYKGWR